MHNAHEMIAKRIEDGNDFADGTMRMLLSALFLSGSMHRPEVVDRLRELGANYESLVGSPLGPGDGMTLGTAKWQFSDAVLEALALRGRILMAEKEKANDSTGQ